MKHHEYTIYIGGKKRILQGYIYCDTCGIQTLYQHDGKDIKQSYKTTIKYVPSHKKQTAETRSFLNYQKKFNPKHTHV